MAPAVNKIVVSFRADSSDISLNRTTGTNNDGTIYNGYSWVVDDEIQSFTPVTSVAHTLSGRIPNLSVKPTTKSGVDISVIPTEPSRGNFGYQVFTNSKLQHKFVPLYGDQMSKVL